jgi:hypothetical protein
MASRGLLAAVRKLQAPRVKYQPGLAKDNLIPANRWNIVRGDKVEMLTGVEKGKQGIVNKVIRKKNQIIVEGFNVVSTVCNYFCLRLCALRSLHHAVQLAFSIYVYVYIALM